MSSRTVNNLVRIGVAWQSIAGILRHILNIVGLITVIAVIIPNDIQLSRRNIIEGVTPPAGLRIYGNRYAGPLFKQVG